MPSDKILSQLVINRIPTQAIYDQLKQKGLISEDELYFIEDSNAELDALLEMIQSELSTGLQSVNEAIDDVEEALDNHSLDFENPHNVTKAQVGLGNVADERQYSVNNPPPYPVTSVNGQVGAVALDAEDVGADASGTAATTTNTHNVAVDAHSDIRDLISELSNRLNAVANSEDIDLDQLAEIVEFIKDNRDLIDGITTSKVSVDDIINNLTTNITNKPLSAAQGVELKGLIDALDSTYKAADETLTNSINSHVGKTSNPHNVTASQVGLGNVNNTADMDKPVSTAQATAIADAKKAGTDAQSNLEAHTDRTDNPHNVQLSQLGVTATAAELNYVDGVTSNIQTQLNNKVTLDTTQTITGTKTFNAPSNINQAEQTTTKFKTSNGGAIVFGKEGANSGTMIRLDQADGTCRLRFRASSTSGAMVWEQPEAGAALFFDLTDSSGVNRRLSMPQGKAGTLALDADVVSLKNKVDAMSSYVQYDSANECLKFVLP